MELRLREDTDPKLSAGLTTFILPHPHSPHFMGRDALLADLREDLTADDLSRHVQALYGFGGVGKSQVAVEFAHAYRDRYSVVCWLPAEEPAALAAAYARLAGRLGLRLAGDDPVDEVCAKVAAHLAGRDDYLLLFDNAGDAQDLRRFIPVPCRGGVLITSRVANWQGLCRSVAVHGLAREDSIQFLQTRVARFDEPQAARKLAQGAGRSATRSGTGGGDDHSCGDDFCGVSAAI